MEYLAGDYDGCNDRERLWECKANAYKNWEFSNVDGHLYPPVVIQFEPKDTFAFWNDTSGIYIEETATWVIADDTLVERF